MNRADGGLEALSQAMSDHTRMARLIASQGVGAVRHALAWPLRLATLIQFGGPERLLIAPQDIRTADPTVAADIYAGYFSFAGRVVNTHGESPFAVTQPSQAWATALAGFGWLRHLRAADTALARANAQALVDDWIQLRGRPDEEIDWQPSVIARRLISWLCQSPLILENADRDFYRRFLKSIARQSSVLQAQLHSGLDGEERLLACIALANLGLCAEGAKTLLKRSTRALADELDRQILGDGGHIGRNPQSLVDLLLDLLPLRQTYLAQSATAPQQLLNAIDRMMPMLRLFRLGDGSLALFNGMGATAPHALATVLAYDDARAEPLTNAPYSGYQRMEASDAIVVMDAGAAVCAEFSRHAHAGCLSFEFSSGQQRIIVNCGSPDESRLVLREAARSTAAHSTLVVADTSSCHFASGRGLSRWLEGRIISGPMQVRAERHLYDQALRVDATHDGYERRFGLIHARSLTMTQDGEQIEGEDRLIASPRRVSGAGSLDYAIRFHLHPAVQPALRDDNRAVEIALPNGDIWLFHAGGLALALEESISFAGSDSVRGSEQIVIHANLRDDSHILWRLARTFKNTL